MSKLVYQNPEELVERCLHWVDIGFIFSGLAAIVILMLTYLWHLMTPLAYLSSHQLQEIRHILLSVVLTSILSSKLKKFEAT